MPRGARRRAAWTGALGPAILLAVLAARSPAVGAAPPGGPSAPIIKLAQSDRGGLLPLRDGGLVLWGQGGRLQLRDPKGAWSPLIPLGLDSIAQVVADDTGLLVSGSHDSADMAWQPVVVRVDGRGVVVDRWERPGSIFSVAVESGHRWATGSGARPLPSHVDSFDPERSAGPLIDERLELLPGGKLEPRGRVELQAQIVSFSGGAKGSARVDCVPANLAKESYHLAYCVAQGPGGWRKVGFWDRPPLACGAYLIEVFDKLGGGDRPTRDQPPQILARRLDNGEVAARRPLPPGQAVACGALGELLLGRDGVQALSLPDLKPRGGWVAVRGGRVVAVARGGAGAGAGDEVLAATASGAVVPVKMAAGALADPRRGGN